MDRQTMLNLISGINDEIDELNGEWVDPDPNEDPEDLPNDLSDAELQTLINQLHTKVKRPRRSIGAI